MICNSPTVRLVNYCFTTCTSRTGGLLPFTSRIRSCILDMDGLSCPSRNPKSFETNLNKFPSLLKNYVLLGGCGKIYPYEEVILIFNFFQKMETYTLLWIIVKQVHNCNNYSFYINHAFILVFTFNFIVSV